MCSQRDSFAVWRFHDTRLAAAAVAVRAADGCRSNDRPTTVPGELITGHRRSRRLAACPLTHRHAPSLGRYETPGAGVSRIAPCHGFFTTGVGPATPGSHASP